jgi:hypothetical protein
MPAPSPFIVEPMATVYLAIEFVKIVQDLGLMNVLLALRDFIFLEHNAPRVALINTILIKILNHVRNAINIVFHALDNNLINVSNV